MKQPLFQGDMVNSSRLIYTPSSFERNSLFHIQEIGSLQAKKPHTSSRVNLSSYLFFIVNSGSGEVVYDNVSYKLSAGDCVFIDCMHPYYHSTSNDFWNLSWVHFNGPSVGEIFQKYIERGGLPAFTPHSPAIYQNILHDLYNIAGSSSYTRDLEINARLAEIMSLLMTDLPIHTEDNQTSKKGLVFEIKKYLDENYAKKITLDELSERYHINKFYLSRIFKDQFDISIIDYLLQIRVTNAKNMLRFTDQSAEEIGLLCGIGDVYYFSRVFKKIEGVNVREYRRKWSEYK